MPTDLRSQWHLLAAYLRPQRRAAALLGVLILTSTSLALLGPQLVRAFIDRVTAGTATGTLVVLAALYIAVSCAGQAVALGATYVGEQVAWGSTNRLRTDLLQHCLRLGLPFHHEHPPGALIERIDGDVTAIVTMISQFIGNIVVSGLLLAGIVAVLLHENLLAGAALAVFAVVTVVALARCRELAVPRLAAERQAYADLYGFVEERLAGLDDVRANGGGDHVMRKFFAAHRQVYRKALAASVGTSTLWTATMGLFAAGSVLMLAVGYYLYQRHAATLGTVYLLFQYTQLLRRPLEQMAAQLREYQKAGAGLGRVLALQRLPEPERNRATGRLPDGPLAVELDRVTFAYRPGAKTLREVSFRLAPGEVLGLLGRTGSGKTTITRLLAGLYEPQAGTVRLSGADVSRVALSELRRRVGVVTQDVQLFEASVRDNLTFFDASVPDERIRGALSELGLGEWLASLPSGLDSALGPGGSGLSAGEAQLLAFARVFLRDPGLVILDEASSRLDPATEALIERAVDRLLAGRTGIVIAHRLATLHRADRVLVLDGGEVVEHGDRGRLAADPASHFGRLLRRGLAEVLV